MEQTHQPGKKTFCLYDAKGDLSKKWFVYWYENGKRIRKYGGINKHNRVGERRKEAEKLIAKLKKEYTPPPANTLQKERIYKVLEDHKHHVRPRTFETYRYKLNCLFDFLQGRELTNESLKEYFREAPKKFHATTVHASFRNLFRIFKMAGMEHLLEGIEVRPGTKTPMRYFQPHQAKRIVRFMCENDPELHLYCMFVYFCFLRPRSELRLLKIDDIFFEERKIIVRAEISKNRKTQFVSIPDAFWPMVEPLRARAPYEHVFESRFGGPRGKNTMGIRFRKVLDHLGFGKGYGLYSWKHTGAVQAVKAGIGLKELQMQLRHHSLDQVNDYLRQLQVTDLDNLKKLFPGI